MKHFKLVLIFIILATAFISCERDQLLEQEIQTITVNSTATIDAVIIGNRNKLRQRPTRNYKSVIVVDDPTNSVTNAVVQYTPLDGENPFPEPFEMQVNTIRKSIRKMQKTQSLLVDGTLENIFPAGKPFQQTATLYNEIGEQVGSQSDTWVTAQDNDGTNINRIESIYLSPSSISIPIRMRTDQPEGITVFARVELYGRILIKGQPLEMEMTVYDETDGNIGLTGTAVAQFAELTDGSDILPGDELQISITTLDANGQLIDEDYFITPVTFSSSTNTIKSSKTFVFGEIIYVETRVNVEAGADIEQITTIVSPLGEQDFESFELELFPVSENENVIKYRSSAQENPVFIAAAGSQNNILHSMVLTGTDGTSTEQAVQSPIQVLEGITRNPKHIIKANGTTRIKMGLKNPIAEQVAYATMSIPGEIVEGDQETITLEAVEGPEDRIFRIDGDFVYMYTANNPDDTTYTTQVTTYNAANEIIGVEEVAFTIEDRRQALDIESNKAFILKTSPTKVIRIKGYVVARPTSGAPVNSSGPANSRITIPQGNLNGTNLIMNLPLTPSGDNSDLYRFEGEFNNVNTDIFQNQFETESLILDEENQVIASGTVIFEVFEVEEVSLIQNEDNETFTLSVYISGSQSQILQSIATFLTPQDGGSDADPEDFTLEFTEDTFDGQLYRNTFVTFADPDSVIDMQYKAELTLLDSEGEELDYLEFDIVGEE